ncbi:MAG: hypothetical protein V4732_22905 [Pseudomonadota bacterium]
MFVTFIALSFVFRFLFPFGDEPDFTYRIEDLLAIDDDSWSLYGFLNFLLSDLQLNSSCIINAEPFSLWARIDSACVESFAGVVYRTILMLFIIAPLFFVIVFPRSVILFFQILKVKFDKQVLSQRLTAVGVSLLFPGMLYSMGVLAQEQLTLMLSLLIFVLWDSLILVGCCIALIMLVDVGNSLVVVTFVLSAIFYAWLAKKLSLKIVFSLMIVQILGAYAIGFSALSLLTSVPLLAPKAQLMMDALSGSDLIDKYPVILRPVITYMSFVFFTPAYIKVPILYVLVAFGVIHMTFRCVTKYSQYQLHTARSISILKGNIVMCLVAISTILSFVFIFPTYGNAKYYIFMLPFIFNLSLNVYSKKTIIKFVLCLNFILLSFLVMYYF